MTNKFTVTPLQQGRFFELDTPLVEYTFTLTRSEAFELKTLLARALADPDPRGDEEAGR
jgi:hypothetical protein